MPSNRRLPGVSMASAPTMGVPTGSGPEATSHSRPASGTPLSGSDGVQVEATVSSASRFAASTTPGHSAASALCALSAVHGTAAPIAQ